MFIVTAAISIRLTFYLHTITGLSGLMVGASPRVPKVPSSIPAKSTCLFIKLICFFVDFDTYTTGILEQTNKKTKTKTQKHRHTVWQEMWLLKRRPYWNLLTDWKLRFFKWGLCTLILANTKPMPSRFLNYLLKLLRDEIFHHTVYNSHAKSWGSNPGTSQSDNSAIYQDATLKFDMRPSLFLMYFFFLWPKEKHDFWKVDCILRIKRNFKTKFGLLFCVYFDWLARTDIKNTKISKNGEKKTVCLWHALLPGGHPSKY